MTNYMEQIGGVTFWKMCRMSKWNCDLQTNAFMAKSLEFQGVAEKDYNITLGMSIQK